MASAEDYVGLIAGGHRGKPKFTAMVGVVAGAFADQNNVAAELAEEFDLDNAIGAQLDVVGEWVGISRRVNTLLTGVYFSLDTDGLGFDQGVWKGPFDPDSGLTVLDDETYRLLIRAKIGANHWDGTMEGSKSILDLIFQGDTHVFVEDNQDMTMTVGVSGKPPSALFLALLTGGYIPIKPEGVRINYYIVTPSDGPLFGFDLNNEYVAGFDTGVWGAVYA
ncbi:DUF2612 domain-containing protein [Chitiniphilus eburneus]|uniref:DUF2612 domain-containing protein n=1 Tax=Chitiniphilus eburneus TaxID=2571148 RepID=A0A4V6WIA5_9NEIS|nr:DUF2612 domain-containing protein [Chitiniphilus eburneus]TJZ75568.1 DUF2612 domain-containing protein [Chitiniphilus eburneus]